MVENVQINIFVKKAKWSFINELLKVKKLNINKSSLKTKYPAITNISGVHQKSEKSEKKKSKGNLLIFLKTILTLLGKTLTKNESPQTLRTSFPTYGSFAGEIIY